MSAPTAWKPQVTRLLARLVRRRAGVLLAMLLWTAPAQAATFNVTKTIDTADGSCTVADCSLREAILAAQNGAGDDIVNVPAGTYPLSTLDELIYNPTVPAGLTLNGAGARATIIDAADNDNQLDILAGTATIVGVTMRNGSATFTGGGIQTASNTTTTLRNVTVADNITGDGGEGGGIYNDGVMTLENVTVEGNRTTFGGEGGGIWTNGELHLVNSTISGNIGGSGGGIYAAGGTLTLRSSTVTGNAAVAQTAAVGGGIFSGRIPEFTNTIVAGNVVGPAAGNCSFSVSATSNGGNLEGGTDCNFTAASDRRNANPMLLPLANNGGQTDTHALMSTSPARDAGVATGCPATDQRGVRRPFGSACDIGAYEFQDLAPPATTVISGPRGSTTDTTPTFTFASTEPRSSFQCRLDGSAFVPCTSPLTLPALPPGAHRLEVRAVDAFGNPDPTPAVVDFSIVLPPPVLGRQVNAFPVSGSVFVSLPAGAARAAQSVPGLKGRRFIPLRQARQVPVGSILDTRKGRVRLQSARDGRGATQSGEFSQGVFQVLQSRRRSARGLTELRLKGSSFRSCGRRRSARKSEVQSSQRRRSRRRIRRLRSNARGRFRTRGRYAAATVRGTIWTVTDRCDGTLTSVRSGRVTVRDLRRKKNISLRRGKSYLAKAP